MKSFEELNPGEKTMLLKFPVYISLLAANNDDSLDEIEKKAAIKFCHIKTFSCNPLLTEFYQQAEKTFEKNINDLDKNLPTNKFDREEIIKTELAKIESVLSKLGTDFASAMYRSMISFKKHVSKAHRNALEYFIFPLPIKGITD
jgi:hypothetical protein